MMVTYSCIASLRLPTFMKEKFPAEITFLQRMMMYGALSVKHDKEGNVLITLYELKSEPIKTTIDLWMSGISDPITGMRTYHGCINDGMEFCLENHSADLAIITMSHAGSFKIDTVYTNLIPITSDLKDSLLDGIVTRTITFRGEVDETFRYNEESVRKLIEPIKDYEKPHPNEMELYDPLMG